METNKIDAALSRAVAPENDRAGAARADRSPAQSAPPEKASSSLSSVSVSLEVSVTLRVEMRALQAQQGRVGEALGEVEGARAGLRRMEAHLLKLRAYAATAARAEDPSVRDAYAQTFRMAQGWFADLRSVVRMPGEALASLLDDDLTRTPGTAQGAGTPSVSATPLGDLLSGIPRSEVIFASVLASGVGDFSTRSSLGQTLSILDSSLSAVGSLRIAYEVIGERLEGRIGSLAAEIANVEAATSVPDTLDEALALAAETRSQVEEEARRAVVAQGVPSPARLLELLAE